MIYTSYFAIAQHVPFPISIALREPGNYPKIPFLAPTSELLYAYKHKNVSETQYIEIYNEMLHKIKPERIISEIKKLKKNFYYTEEDVTLCCWEKSGYFCHRHLVSQYLSEAGYMVAEWAKSPSLYIANAPKHGKLAPGSSVSESNPDGWI